MKNFIKTILAFGMILSSTAFTLNSDQRSNTHTPVTSNDLLDLCDEISDQAINDLQGNVAITENGIRPIFLNINYDKSLENPIATADGEIVPMNIIPNKSHELSKPQDKTIIVDMTGQMHELSTLKDIANPEYAWQTPFAPAFSTMATNTESNPISTEDGGIVSIR